jgi:D-lactate dehydrogenase
VKAVFFDLHRYEKRELELVPVPKGIEFHFLTDRLSEATVYAAQGAEVVCCFVNDDLGEANLRRLHAIGVKLIALRSAGFNHVHLPTVRELGLVVVRVPEYSPHAVAEHAVALLLTLNRKTHRAFNRVREGNFSLDGLVGFDLYKKKVGVVGLGRIGTAFAQIMNGFGAEVLAFDRDLSRAISAGVKFRLCDLEALFKESDIISLHVPLTSETHHLVNEKLFSVMKTGAILINTSRGRLIDTKSLISSLKDGRLGGAGLDVYEEEEGLFFEDHSLEPLTDENLTRLLTFPNVLMTSHQGFLTHEALRAIAETTIQSIQDFLLGKELQNKV